jgi:hypothetical protein
MWEDFLNALTPTLDQIVAGTLPEDWKPTKFSEIGEIAWKSVRERLKYRQDLRDLVADLMSSDTPRAFSYAIEDDAARYAW